MAHHLIKRRGGQRYLYSRWKIYWHGSRHLYNWPGQAIQLHYTHNLLNWRKSVQGATPARWLLGGSDSPATMWLVVDRVTEWAWLVPADEAWDVLRMQYPAAELPALAMTVDELLAALDAAVAQFGSGRVAVDLDFDQAMARQAELDAKFEAALRGRVASIT